eukprot:COSAG01_NODE_16237_length_1256_cov_2.070009_1_plen_82_part_10
MADGGLGSGGPARRTRQIKAASQAEQLLHIMFVLYYMYAVIVPERRRRRAHPAPAMHTSMSGMRAWMVEHSFGIVYHSAGCW